MSYIKESLSQGERIERIFKPHRFAWFSVIFWLVAGVFLLFIPWLWAIPKLLELASLEQGVTNKRIIVKTGVIGRKTEEMRLTSIETVEIRQGVAGRIFGFGDVKITGRGISDVTFKGVDNPMSVKRQIESVNSVK